MHSPAYVPAIDGLRAIAVLAVIVFHLNVLELLPGGFTGVDMFFVISGYVISRSLHDQARHGFRAFVLAFYRRRLLRILPALLLVLAASFIVSALLVPPVWLSDHNDRTGLAAFFGLSNFVLAWNTDTYFSPRADLNPYLHTWSLGVEEQFYLVFPVLCFLCLRYRHQVKWLWAVLPALALASLVVSAVQTTTEPLAAFYLLPARFWELAAGAMLFQLIGTRVWAARWAGMAQLLLGSGLALVLCAMVLAQPARFPFPWALASVAGTLMMIAAVTVKPVGARAPLQALLQSSPMTYIGRLSYSLYLWHWPVAVFLRWTIGLEHLAVQLAYPLVVLTLAAASYHWVEVPVRRGQTLLQRRAGVTLGAGISATVLLWWSATWVSENAERLSLSQVSDTYTWHAYKHYPQAPISPVTDPRVQGRQLFVIGDSHTAAYRTLLHLVALERGITVIEYERGGCGVVSLIGQDPTDCAQLRETQWQAIETRAKPGDVVFLASLRMPELAGRAWQQGEGAALAAAHQDLSPANLEHARHAAKAVLDRLQAAGLNVLIDAPKPLFKAPANRCSDAFNRMNPVCAPGLTIDRTQLQSLRAAQMALLASLASEYPRLHVWDPFPLLCPTRICSAYDQDGKPLFADADHLSGHGNRVLWPSFSKALVEIWHNTDQ